MEDLLREILTEEELERFRNPIVSDFERKMNERGWIRIDNDTFYSMMDDLIIVGKVWGEEINIRQTNLKERMRRKRAEYLSRNEEPRIIKVRFTRAFDIYGQPVAKEHMARGVYVKYNVN